MNPSIINELKDYIIDLINEGVITEDNLDDAHHIAFNQDYYIIGYSQAVQWLEKHDESAWDAIEYVIEQEEQHFGEVNIKPEDINPERIVNLLVFFAGYGVDIEDIFNELKVDEDE